MDLVRKATWITRIVFIISPMAEQAHRFNEQVRSFDAEMDRTLQDLDRTNSGTHNWLDTALGIQNEDEDEEEDDAESNYYSL